MLKLFAWIISLAILVVPVWGLDEFTVLPANRSVLISGYTRSRARMEISSEVNGKVVQVNYDIGQTIGPKPFVQIDPTFVNLQIEQVRRSLQNLSVAKKQAASRVDYLDKEFRRIDALYKDEVATESGHDAAGQALYQAQLELQATDVEISKMQSQLKELQERLLRHNVYAPQGWVMVGRQVEPGEIVSTGAPLGRAADFSRMVVPFYVTTQELRAIQGDRGIELAVDGQKVQAKLNWVNPEFDERTRKLAIELIIDKDAYQGAHRGGLLVELSVQVPETKGFMVPRAAVVNRYDNPRVILAEGRKPVPVVILGENGKYLRIADNQELAIGDRLQKPVDD